MIRSRMFIFLTFVAATQSTDQERCPAGVCDENQLLDDTSLLQVNRHASLIEPKSDVNKYGPTFIENTRVIDYFQNWHSTAISIAKKKMASSPSPVMSLVEANADSSNAMWSLACPDLAASADRWELLEAEAVEDVMHALFRGSDGNLQYVAMETQGAAPRILHADPAVCAPAALVEDDTPSTTLQPSDQSKSKKIPGKKAADEPELLDPANDHLVADCVALFSRTVHENCGEKYTFNVLSATVEVIDGLKVSLSGTVVGGLMPTHHNPRCFFEVGKSVQSSDDVPSKELLPEEKKGERATLELQTPLCEIGVVNGVPEDEIKANIFQEQHGMGDLIFTKGHEHDNDDFPDLELDEDLGSAVASLDFTKKYRRCFPGYGKAVVRNQGQCGSCWAFATATSTMNSLCIDALYKKHASSRTVLRSATKRYEVSVQQILSCGPGSSGCHGGSAYGGNQKNAKNGLLKESVSPYQCGSGNPLNHFESGNSCKKFPWGGSCKRSKDPAWKYLGGYRVSGEAKMKSALVSGYSMYTSFKVYSNFMQYRGGVYTGPGGSARGGHAVSLVGYGRTGTLNYWKLQNSWGPSWGENGYFRFVRGRNACTIESRSIFAFKASSSGGRTRQATCPQKFPVCYSNGNCVSQSCAAGGCSWRKGSNYLWGIDNAGTKCKSSYSQAKLTNLGASGCTKASKCGLCAGDCDSDADCRSGLSCFQRNGKTSVPGCVGGGSGDVTNYDYCYQAREFLAIKKQNVWQQGMLENDGKDAEEDGKEKEIEIADNEEKTEETFR